LVHGLSLDRGSYRRSQEQTPGFHGNSQPGIDHGASLKVFFQTSHRNMPNLIITPAQADDLVNYILSLKRD
jgi:cytochrome c